MVFALKELPQPLTYLHTQNYTNTMMNNWLDTMLDYNFEVIHLKGIDVLPDRLSRLFPVDESLEGGMVIEIKKVAQVSLLKLEPSER